MPKPDPLGSQPSADIIEFFARCAKGERLVLRFAKKRTAINARFRLNSVRKHLREQGQFTEWGIVQLALRPLTDDAGDISGWSIVGQLRDEEFDDAFAEALANASPDTQDTEAQAPQDSDGLDDITNILNAKYEKGS